MKKYGFDSVVSVYERKIAGSGAQWTIRHSIEAIEKINKISGSVLDCGCGTGLYSKFLLSRTTGVIGFDISKAMIEKAKEKGLNVFCADCNLTLPFKDDTFDIVLTTDVLTYVEDIPQFFREALRVLKPSGFLFAITPNYSSIVRKFVSLFKLGSYSVKSPDSVNSFTYSTFNNLLRSTFRKCGMKTIRPVPGFAGPLFDRFPLITKSFFFSRYIGLGLLGWAQKS